MTLLLGYTVLMTIFNVINSIFTYRLFKQLSSEANMSKNKNDSKGVNISSEDGINSCGSLSYEVAFTPDSVPPVNETDSGGSIGGKGNADVPFAGDNKLPDSGEDDMLNRLRYLSDFLNDKFDAKHYLTEEQWEDMKWETINETYCLITVDLPRRKAEVVRRYFRKLDITRVRKDNTYYSTVVDGKAAKGVIDELIDVYPWDEVDKDSVKVNLEGFRKAEFKTGHDNEHFGPKDKLSICLGSIPKVDQDLVSREQLKDTIGTLSKAVEKLNEILGGK